MAVYRLIGKLGLALAVLIALPSMAEAIQKKGWYARGNLGGSFSADGQVDDQAGAANLQLISSPLSKLGDSPLIGGGFGYKLNKMFRFDVTFDYRLGFELDDRDNSASRQFNANVTSVLGLFNGYFNLPLKLGRIRPYVSAGIGFAYNDVEDVLISDPTNGSLQIPGGTNGYVAWTAGAGAVYPLNNWFDVNLAYRYVDAGRIETDQISGFTFGSAVGTEGLRGDLESHEFLLGFHYNF